MTVDVGYGRARYGLRMEQAGELGSDALVGHIVAGRYRVDRVLAEGGMGLVVAATHLHLDQPVALKLPRGEIVNNSEALARFTREARAAAQLKSEHVARVLDAGVSADGSPYMVMEYLEGHSLAQLLEMQGRLDVESATEYAIQVCEGLAEAHARGIVHRDVKPDNLFLVERAPGRQIVKLIDFGISKISFAEKGNLETSMIMGSPCYMSPEQLRSTATVDHRTDLWSLGATLFELLAGKGPFDGSQPLADLFVSILERPAPNLRELCPEIPEALSATIARCLERNREVRLQTAAEVAMALLPFAPARARDTAERAASMPTILRRSRVAAERTARVVDEAPVSDGEPTPPAPDETSSPAASLALVLAPPEMRAEDASAPAVTAPPPATPPLRRSVWRSVVLGSPVTTIAAGGIAIVLALALVARPRSPDARLANVAMAAVASPAAAAEGQVLQDPQRTSELFVRASPATAKVTIDGVAVSGNPFRARYPRSEIHVVGATAAGYEAKSEQVSLVNDVLLDVSLDPRAVTTTRTSWPVAIVHPRHAVTAPASEPLAGAVAGGTGSIPTTSTSALEVDPTGGHAILHPIESSNPYGTP